MEASRTSPTGLDANSGKHTERLIAGLRDILDERGILLGDDVSARYPGYFMTRIESRILVRPKTTQEVSAASPA